MAGQPLTAGYEVGHNIQQRYLAASRHKEFAILWVPPQARRAFGDDPQSRQFLALGIETLPVSLAQHLASQPLLRQPLPAEVLRRLQHYVHTRDIIALRQLQRDYQLQRLLIPQKDQALLQLATAEGILAIVNLQPLGAELIVQPADLPLQPLLSRFLDRRAFLLQFGDAR